LIFGRRVTFALVVIISQLLLIATSATLLIELVVIFRNGSVNFIENNAAILAGEVTAAALISLFALVVLVLQWKRLGERRKGDRPERRHAQ
jgi:hypothetical protein